MWQQLLGIFQLSSARSVPPPQIDYDLFNAGEQLPGNMLQEDED